MQLRFLCDELNESAGMIQALLAGIPTEHARERPDDQSWSIIEVVCHLYDEEREDFREHLDFILHRQNEEWHLIDPEAWVLQREYNGRDLEEMKAKFHEERSRSLEWLGSLGDTDWNKIYASRWGEMSAGSMLASWVAHDSLHIRQLVELRRKWIERITRPYDIAYAGEW